MTFDIKQIMKVLPHRFPFLLVDRILELTPFQKVVGLKNVSISDIYLMGHFPDDPIVPGVLIIETMAQTGGFIFLEIDSEGGLKQSSLKGYITGVDQMKFLQVVRPGDQMIIEAEFKQKFGSMAKIEGKVKVDDKVVASGMITYNFEKFSKV